MTEDSQEKLERSPEEIREKMDSYEQAIENERVSEFELGAYHTLQWVMGDIE